MSYLNIFQIIIALALTATVLIQQRGAGGSAIFGESGGASYFRKRGLEKTLSWITIILAAVFIILSLIRITLG